MQPYAQERLNTTDPSLLINAVQYHEWKDNEVRQITELSVIKFFLHELDAQVSLSILLKQSLTVNI